MHQSIQSLKILIWTTLVAFELLKICLLKSHPRAPKLWSNALLGCWIGWSNFLSNARSAIVTSYSLTSKWFDHSNLKPRKPFPSEPFACKSEFFPLKNLPLKKHICWKNLEPFFQIPYPTQEKFKFPSIKYRWQSNAHGGVGSWGFRSIGA